MDGTTKPQRTRLERGIYRQPDGKLAVCARHAGRLHFRTCDGDLEAARQAREELVAGLAAGRVPASPRLRLDTVAGRWGARFEAMVVAGERHKRTYEARRFHLDHDILPRLGHRRRAAPGSGIWRGSEIGPAPRSSSEIDPARDARGKKLRPRQHELDDLVS